MSKFKLKTMRKTFLKFGFDLKDSNTDLKLQIPKNLSRLSEFKTTGPTDIDNIDSILNKKWSKKLTQSNPLGACVLCGSTNQVEMHHLRKINNIRQKVRTGNITYAQWKGAVLRKQIPLCKPCHIKYHRGQLTLPLPIEPWRIRRRMEEVG